MSPLTPEIALSLELGLESQQTRSWSKEVEFSAVGTQKEFRVQCLPQLAQLQPIILELLAAPMPVTE